VNPKSPSFTFSALSSKMFSSFRSLYMRRAQNKSTDVHNRPYGYRSPPHTAAQTGAGQPAPLTVCACRGSQIILPLTVNNFQTLHTTMAILQHQPNQFLSMYNFIKLRNMGMTQSAMMINLPC
jgi:hypothetical protein